MVTSQKFVNTVVSVLIIAVYLDAVTVKPSLCPTNKIAPHRRVANWREDIQPRTLGLIYGLISPNRPPRPYINGLNDLQEQPQEDDPDDCGDIEDYDESDLSSITPGLQNIYNNRRHRQSFDGSHNIPPYFSGLDRHRPIKKPRPPPISQKPIYYPPNKPFFGSGETHESHVYRPPSHQNPSTYVKPVHENIYDNPTNAYSPDLIGGILGGVAGFTTVRPTVPSNKVTSQRKPRKPIRFPDGDSYNKRQTRAKQPNVAANIVGSFVDLIFN